MKEPTLRPTGQTMAALRDAPRNAVYICPGPGAIDYTFRLACYLGRLDVKIISPDGIERLQGERRPIVIDHAVALTPRQMATVLEMRRTS